MPGDPKHGSTPALLQWTGRCQEGRWGPWVTLLREVCSPRGKARRRGGWSDANALVKLQFEDWLPHDHHCVAGSPSVTSGAVTAKQ